MSDTSALDTLRIEKQATPAGMAYHAARHPKTGDGLTAVTNIATKQTSVMLDGQPIGRVHTLSDMPPGALLWRAESYRTPGFWCGRSLWDGTGPDGYFQDPVEAMAAMVADSIEWENDTPMRNGLNHADDFQIAERAMIPGFVLTARITSEGRACFAVWSTANWTTGCYSLPLLDRYAETFDDAQRLATSAGAALLVTGVTWSMVDAELTITRWLEAQHLPPRRVW
ncbi:hypothetical protein [Azospirillum argentinense]|uniref:Uncharacterized protein n=1 Tax=Azospirillum brasilense TaxID=192 RepID=A0A4D8QEK9_AZOBR|nr:hypothetical protein [Azospirillum argentinense]QCO07303.1 hypothetical protein D3867_36085 [Azospirillum argentinense]